MGRKRPWISGLIDGISASNLIRGSTIEHKNRIAFIILDSTLEIAFKKFIVNVKRITNLDESIWKDREKINKIVKSNTKFEEEVWEDVKYYYGIRTGLYHEDSEKTVTDSMIDDFQELVEFFINNLFEILCSQLVPITTSLLPTVEENIKILDQEQDNYKIPINKIKEKINVIIIAVGESKSQTYDDILNILRRKGFRGEISKHILRIYMNDLYKHMFYFDMYWKLSEEGLSRYEKLKATYLVKQKGEEYD